jgi:hypothetical protein
MIWRKTRTIMKRRRRLSPDVFGPKGLNGRKESPDSEQKHRVLKS